MYYVKSVLSKFTWTHVVTLETYNILLFSGNPITVLQQLALVVAQVISDYMARCTDPTELNTEGFLRAMQQYNPTSNFLSNVKSALKKFGFRMVKCLFSRDSAILRFSWFRGEIQPKNVFVKVAIISSDAFRTLCEEGGNILV